MSIVVESRSVLRTMVLALLSAALVAACGHARRISQTPSGGIFALEGDRGKALADADQQMARHCGAGNYRVTRTGEVVIGQDAFTSHGGDRPGEEPAPDGGDTGALGASSTGGGSGPRVATEWRLHYLCGGAAVAPPPPP